MNFSTYQQRRELALMSPERKERHQLQRLNQMLTAILPQNRFYAESLGRVLDLEAVQAGKPPLASLSELSRFPYTFKDELSPCEPNEPAVHHTFERRQYTRLHQTSGTHGRPLIIQDTPDDWRWWCECWQFVLDAARVGADDCAFMAFSFGPFIGFWSAADALLARRCQVVSGGGMRSHARLQWLRATQSTVLCCTPSYALHLIEVGQEHQIDVGSLGVRQLILAGEPGGSIPSVRARLEDAWQASVLDHAGATEVGPWGFGNRQGTGLHLLESEFIAEFLAVETGLPAADGELAELVLTNLGRYGCPVIRYRTGDLVRPVHAPLGDCQFVFLPSGVVGRADDMLLIRGVNLFPTAIEQVVRSFPEIIEYRVIVRRVAEMDAIEIEIEGPLAHPQRLADELHARIGLQFRITNVPLGTLPRFEGKGKRIVDERKTT